MSIALTLVIPAKSTDDPKLKDLLESIDSQSFPKNKLQTLVITEGTSESAKAIGIRRAKGEVIGILASDNVLGKAPDFLTLMYSETKYFGATYPQYYAAKGNLLNRYFARIGGNDPLSYYMGKNDRVPHWVTSSARPNCTCGKTLGDNGYFVLRDWIAKTDLDHYYHIDNANETRLCARPLPVYIIHNTGDTILSFLRKRYHYGLQHAFNPNRRWHLVDFKRGGDIFRLIWFVLASVTFIHPLVTAMRGYSKIHDPAWLIHPIMCFLTVVTYATLVCHLCSRRLFQSLSAPWTAGRA